MSQPLRVERDRIHEAGFIAKHRTILTQEFAQFRNIGGRLVSSGYVAVCHSIRSQVQTVGNAFPYHFTSTLISLPFVMVQNLLKLEMDTFHIIMATGDLKRGVLESWRVTCTQLNGLNNNTSNNNRGKVVQYLRYISR
jgi:hypothetical protein